MKEVGTLEVAENASVADIEAMIKYGLENEPFGLECRSNEDGTYTIYRVPVEE